MFRFGATGVSQFTSFGSHGPAASFVGKPSSLEEDEEEDEDEEELSPLLPASFSGLALPSPFAGSPGNGNRFEAGALSVEGCGVGVVMSDPLVSPGNGNRWAADGWFFGQSAVLVFVPSDDAEPE